MGSTSVAAFVMSSEAIAVDTVVVRGIGLELTSVVSRAFCCFAVMEHVVKVASVLGLDSWYFHGSSGMGAENLYFHADHDSWDDQHILYLADRSLVCCSMMISLPVHLDQSQG